VADLGGSAEERLAREQLVRELNVNAQRELALAVRIEGLERNRWSMFSLVELEWLTNAQVASGLEAHFEPTELPEQANAELERRARAPGRQAGDDRVPE
jgi:hypothetical protein